MVDEIIERYGEIWREICEEEDDHNHKEEEKEKIIP